MTDPNSEVYFTHKLKGSIIYLSFERRKRAKIHRKDSQKAPKI